MPTINWPELQRVTRMNWRAIVLPAIVLGFLVAVVTFYLGPKTWSAVAIIKIGQLGQVGTVLQAGQIGINVQATLLVEPPGRVIERMKSYSFQIRLLRHLGLEWNIHDGILARTSLRLRSLPPDLIEISVRGRTQEQARRFILAYVDALVEEHRAASAPTLARWSQQIANIDKQIQAYEKSRDALANVLAHVNPQAPNQANFNRTLALVALNVIEKDLYTLKDSRLAFDDQLARVQLQETALLGEIGFPSDSESNLVFPLGSAAFLLGLLLGFTWSLHRATRTRSASSETAT